MLVHALERRQRDPPFGPHKIGYVYGPFTVVDFLAGNQHTFNIFWVCGRNEPWGQHSQKDYISTIL